MDKAAPWDETWINIAIRLSKRSKDPFTKVGCIIVSPDNKMNFVGYNGFVAGFEETSELWSRKVESGQDWRKYDLVVHAEQNALDHRNCDVNGWTAYVTCRPCERCALRIANNKIAKVIHIGETKSADYHLSDYILKQGKVELIKYEGKIYGDTT